MDNSAFGKLPIPLLWFQKYGILSLHRRKNGAIACFLELPNGCILTTEKRSEPEQLLLPFPWVEETKRLLFDWKQQVEQAWRILDFLPCRRTVVLQFIVKGGRAAVELLESCPALALLLAMRIYNDPTAWAVEKVRALAGIKRQKILSYCAYPADKWVVRLLQKIPAAHCSPMLLGDLELIIRRNRPAEIKTLRHLPRISRLVVDVLKDRETAELAARSFYTSAAAYPAEDFDIEAYYLLAEIQRFSRDVPEITIPLVRSVRHLQTVHDRCSEQYNDLFGEQCLELSFSRAPVPGLLPDIPDEGTGIFPLQSGRDLFLEGKKMHHCIASYADRISWRGDLYAYHICSPEGEEASVMLKKNNITWGIGMIRGICNERVQEETRQYVEEWLAEYNIRLLEMHQRRGGREEGSS